MARLLPESAAELILAKIAAAGGTITHNALVTQLEADGNGAAVEHVLRLTQTGAIKAQVVAIAVGENELRYSAGGNA